MEEILSSIKRIIAEEGEEAVLNAPRSGRGSSASLEFVPSEIAIPAPALDDEILELTEESVVEEPVAIPKAARATKDAAESASILSVESEIATRQSLSALSSMLINPNDGEDNTLDGLVRSMLRPMLKEWLDTHLPSMVEDMVAKEIARITAR